MKAKEEIIKNKLGKIRLLEDFFPDNQMPVLFKNKSHHMHDALGPNDAEKINIHEDLMEPPQALKFSKYISHIYEGN